MEDTRIKFDTAKLAKDKGFNEECRFHFEVEYPDQEPTCNHEYEPYRNSEIENGYGKCTYPMISAPTQSELQTWLRKTHGIKLWCEPHEYSSSDGWAFNLLGRKEGFVTVSKGNQASSVHLTYEQALEEGLQEALTLIEKDLEVK